MKLKRIFAWIIDWNLCGIPALVYAFIFGEITQAQGLKPLYALIFVLFVLSFPVIFVLRDVIFKGRSIAKRIFRICVIDNKTNVLPSKQKLIIRNLFFFIYPIEAIMLIATSKSIGDMVTNTTIVKSNVI